MDAPHLLACARYVEGNPVKAGLVARAEDWPWSSARAHLAGGNDLLCAAAPLLERAERWLGAGHCCRLETVVIIGVTLESGVWSPQLGILWGVAKR